MPPLPSSAPKKIAAASGAVAALTFGALGYAVWLTLQIKRQAAADQTLDTTLAQLKAMWNYSPVSIILFNPFDPKIKIRIVNCNPRACEMHGGQREELIGQSIDLLEARPWTANATDWIADFRRHHRFEGESEHRCQDGCEATTRIRPGRHAIRSVAPVCGLFALLLGNLLAGTHELLFVRL